MFDVKKYRPSAWLTKGTGDWKKSRIPGEQILFSTDAFFSGRTVRQSRDEFRPSNPKGSRGFESPSLHHSVRWFSYLSENRSKNARVRAIRDHAWTRRASPAA